MALHSPNYFKTCPECGEETVSNDLYRDPTCSKCLQKAAKAKEDAHIEELRKMSLEERVERLERILYNTPWSEEIVDKLNRATVQLRPFGG